MKEQPNQRKQMLYYCGLVIIVMLLLNIFVFPALLQPQVTEVTWKLNRVEKVRVSGEGGGTP